MRILHVPKVVPIDLNGWRMHQGGQAIRKVYANHLHMNVRIITALMFFTFLHMLSFSFCVQIRNKKMQGSTEQTHLFTQPQHMYIPPISFKLNQNTTWLCWYFDWTFEARGGWSYKWRVVDNVNTLWLDWACWVAKGQGGALCWLLSKDSSLKFLW